MEVKALIASIITDSRLIPSSLHTVAKFDIADGQSEECDPNRYPH
jgi:hypothetical protein